MNRKHFLKLLPILTLGACSPKHIKETSINLSKNDIMKLGAFSVSLNVKNLKTSKAFYEKLGFKKFGGAMEMNYLIMKNETTLIGLFQGMFEGNILTFNPGWDHNAQKLDEFQDVREIEKSLKSDEIKFEKETGDSKEGPASFIIMDPDGNAILVDQHV